MMNEDKLQPNLGEYIPKEIVIRDVITTLLDTYSVDTNISKSFLAKLFQLIIDAQNEEIVYASKLYGSNALKDFLYTLNEGSKDSYISTKVDLSDKAIIEELALVIKESERGTDTESLRVRSKASQDAEDLLEHIDNINLKTIERVRSAHKVTGITLDIDRLDKIDRLVNVLIERSEGYFANSVLVQELLKATIRLLFKFKEGVIQEISEMFDFTEFRDYLKELGVDESCNENMTVDLIPPSMRIGDTEKDIIANYKKFLES